MSINKNTFLSIVSLIFFCLTAKAQNTEWLITNSSITFKIKNAGFNTDGAFGGLKGKIFFDATKSYSNTIEATIDVKTINTGSSGKDTHLKKDEYFGVEKYPTISLKASTFAKQADGSFKGYFKLTIKSTTKDIIIPFTFSEKEGKGKFVGQFTINRRDYGVGGSSMILSDNATIFIETTVTKK